MPPRMSCVTREDQAAVDLDRRQNWLSAEETYQYSWNDLKQSRKDTIKLVFDIWDEAVSHGRTNAQPFDVVRGPMTTRPSTLGEPYDVGERFLEERMLQQKRRDPKDYYRSEQAKIIQAKDGQKEIGATHNSRELLNWVYENVTPSPDILWCAILGMQLFHTATDVQKWFQLKNIETKERGTMQPTHQAPLAGPAGGHMITVYTSIPLQFIQWYTDTNFFNLITTQRDAINDAYFPKILGANTKQSGRRKVENARIRDELRAMVAAEKARNDEASRKLKEYEEKAMADFLRTYEPMHHTERAWNAERLQQLHHTERARLDEERLAKEMETRRRRKDAAVVLHREIELWEAECHSWGIASQNYAASREERKEMEALYAEFDCGPDGLPLS